MLSPGNQVLPRPSPAMCESLLGFIPSDDVMAGLEPSSHPSASLHHLDTGQEDLRDLLYEMRGDGASRWNTDAPSFGDFGADGTQGWISNPPALAFGGGPSETFGAFATHPGQVTDTAGTPFHPLSTHFGQAHMHMQSAGMAPMPAPTPCMAPQYQAGNPWGMAPHQGMVAYPPGYPRAAMAGQPLGAPMGYPSYGCNFPQGCGMPMPVPMGPPGTNMPPGAYPMPFNPFLGAQHMGPNGFVSPPGMQQAQAANLTRGDSRVVPSMRLPATLSGILNNACGIDGNSSGDEAGHPPLSKCRKGSVSSSDSGLGLQVVPEQPDSIKMQGQQSPRSGGNGAAPAHPQNMIFPEGVVLVPYNGGYMAVRRPCMGATNPAANVAETVVLPIMSPVVGLPMSTRAACLARYRQKKAVRSYSKNIRYHMRKVNADRRPRVKGRFIKASVVTEVAEALNNQMDVEESS